MIFFYSICLTTSVLYHQKKTPEKNWACTQKTGIPVFTGTMSSIIATLVLNRINEINHILETAIFQCDLQLLPPTFWFNSPRMSMIAVYFTSNGKMSTGQTANSTSTTWRHASMAFCFARNISLTRLRSTECFSSTRSSYEIKIVYFQNFIGRQFTSSEINLSPIISPFQNYFGDFLRHSCSSSEFTSDMGIFTICF